MYNTHTHTHIHTYIHTYLTNQCAWVHSCKPSCDFFTKDAELHTAACLHLLHDNNMAPAVTHCSPLDAVSLVKRLSRIAGRAWDDRFGHDYCEATHVLQPSTPDTPDDEEEDTRQCYEESADFTSSTSATLSLVSDWDTVSDLSELSDYDMELPKKL